MRLRAVSLGGLTFSSEFDSGNLARVEQRGDSEFALWTSGDTDGARGTWFAFAVRGATRGRVLHFLIHNLTLHKLWRHNMKPVWRALPSKPGWSRVRQAVPSFGAVAGEAKLALHICHKVETPSDDTLHFAFCYPYTYADCMARLAWLR